MPHSYLWFLSSRGMDTCPNLVIPHARRYLAVRPKQGFLALGAITKVFGDRS